MNQEYLDNKTFEKNSHFRDAGDMNVGDYFIDYGRDNTRSLVMCTKNTDCYVHYKYVDFKKIEPRFNDKIGKYKYYFIFINGGKEKLPLHDNTFRVKNSTTIIAPNTREIIWKKKY